MVQTTKLSKMTFLAQRQCDNVRLTRESACACTAVVLQCLFPGSNIIVICIWHHGLHNQPVYRALTNGFVWCVWYSTFVQMCFPLWNKFPYGYIGWGYSHIPSSNESGEYHLNSQLFLRKIFLVLTLHCRWVMNVFNRQAYTVPRSHFAVIITLKCWL